MQSDGCALLDLPQTLVLRQFRLIHTGRLPRSPRRGRTNPDIGLFIGLLMSGTAAGDDPNLISRPLQEHEINHIFHGRLPPGARIRAYKAGTSWLDGPIAVVHLTWILADIRSAR